MYSISREDQLGVAWRLSSMLLLLLVKKSPAPPPPAPPPPGWSVISSLCDEHLENSSLLSPCQW